jgi:hypothetical protein
VTDFFFILLWVISIYGAYVTGAMMMKRHIEAERRHRD